MQPGKRGRTSKRSRHLGRLERRLDRRGRCDRSAFDGRLLLRARDLGVDRRAFRGRGGRGNVGVERLAEDAERLAGLRVRRVACAVLARLVRVESKPEVRNCEVLWCKGLETRVVAGRLGRTSAARRSKICVQSSRQQAVFLIDNRS